MVVGVAGGQSSAIAVVPTHCDDLQSTPSILTLLYVFTSHKHTHTHTHTHTELAAATGPIRKGKNHPEGYDGCHG